MKQFSLLLASLFLISCNDVDGVMDVFTDFTLQGKKSELLIKEGRHDVTLKFKRDDHIQLKMIVDGKNQTINFKLARDYDFPRNNGEFEIPAEDNSQGLDVAGSVATDYEDGPRRWEREACERTEYRRRCRQRRDGRRICDRVPVRVRGWRDVDYHFEYKDQELQLELSAEGDALSSFNSRTRYQRRVVDYRGPCR